MRDGKLYARGAVDDKGDTLAGVRAAEIYRTVYGELPLRLKFFVEGEEEVGSPHWRRWPSATPICSCGTATVWRVAASDDAERSPSIAASRDRLLGSHPRRPMTCTRAVRRSYLTPAWRLVHALSTLKDVRDNVTVDGLLAYVRPPTDAELASSGASRSTAGRR